MEYGDPCVRIMFEGEPNPRLTQNERFASFIIHDSDKLHGDVCERSEKVYYTTASCYNQPNIILELS